ncbi:MAG: hypothetical protein IKV35_05195 [Clostridia bacterium]|nr:hypothetical protein [Clostridia bacterium]
MKIKCLKIPALILAIGLVAAVAAYMLTAILRVPTVTEHDFHYSATYRLDGETKTLEGVYRCRFGGTGEGTEPLERYYEGFHLSDPDAGQPKDHIIATKDDLELRVVFIFTNDYLMGDDRYDEEAVEEPYLAVYDKEGYEYTEPEKLGLFDVELISWELPEPVDNSFVFAGFSLLHDDSMAAMFLVGLLTIIACIIFVKRDKTVPYKALDIISIVLNVLVGVLALPFMTLVVYLMGTYVSGDELIYQIDLCVPALTAFTIAASVALRRKGFKKSGFAVQFVGPVLFAVLAVLETVL